MSGDINLRAVAVVLHEGRVLLHRSEDDDFWSLPGGRIEFRESSAEAIRREVREELGVDAGVERLLWVVEEFFTYMDVPRHEFGFYYLVSLAGDGEVYRREAVTGWEGARRLTFRWHLLDRLDEITLVPGFLRERLTSIPAATEYVLWRS